jgi:hypothetical protein
MAVEKSLKTKLKEKIGYLPSDGLRDIDTTKAFAAMINGKVLITGDRAEFRNMLKKESDLIINQYLPNTKWLFD